MASYSSIHVLPIACNEPADSSNGIDEDGHSSKESLADCVDNEMAENVEPSLSEKSPSKCPKITSKNTCILIPNEESPQEQAMSIYAEEVKDSRIVSRHRMCNLMRNMQQTHIAELFPIIESRETTEGSEEQVICRICHAGGDETLIAPCKCIGSAQFVHATCLLTWFKKSVKNQCELCQHQVPIKKQRKPVSKWKKPEEKPIPLIWFMVFFVGLCLNILSIHVNASERCKSTACLIFYVVNGFGIVLDAAFLWFWWIKCVWYWRKWWAINQDWSITEKAKTAGTIVTYERKNKSQEALHVAVEVVETGDKLAETVIM